MKKWFLGRCSQCHTTKLKLDEEKLKCAGLAEENGFDSALLHTIWWLVRDIAMLWGAMLWTCRKECNKYDLTAAQYFWLMIIMIGWGGLLWVVHHHHHLFAAPVSLSFMGRHYITKFECEKYFFARSHSEHNWRCSNVVI